MQASIHGRTHQSLPRSEGAQGEEVIIDKKKMELIEDMLGAMVIALGVGLLFFAISLYRLGAFVW